MFGILYFLQKLFESENNRIYKYAQTIYVNYLIKILSLIYILLQKVKTN